VFRALKPGYADHKDISIGNYVRFCREKKGWSVPCQVLAFNRNIITVMHNARHKTASRNSVMTCDPPFALLLNPEECDLDFEGCLEVGSDHFATPNTDESKGENSITDTSAAVNDAPEAQTEADSDKNRTVNQRDDRANVMAQISSMLLRSAGRAQSQQSQAEGQSVTFQSTHFFSSMPFTSSSKLEKQEEMAESYFKKRTTG
jgi:hypothetical protein